MLIDLMNGKQITKVPYASEYRTFMSRLTDSEIAEIKTDINGRIDGSEIQTAGWMPGKSWPHPLSLIYTKAARYDYAASARCFGLMVWEVFMQRPERWASGRFEKDGVPINSRTYFQVS